MQRPYTILNECHSNQEHFINEGEKGVSDADYETIKTRRQVNSCVVFILWESFVYSMGIEFSVRENIIMITLHLEQNKHFTETKYTQKWRHLVVVGLPFL